MALYGKVSYWDERYLATAENGPCEWYQSFHNLRHLLNPIHFAATQNAASSVPSLSSNISSVGGTAATVLLANTASTGAPTVFPSRDKCRVLILGCGDSGFGEDMQRDGWTGPIVNIDFSSVVIAQMKAKYNDDFYQKLNWNKRNSVPKMQWVCADMTEKLPFADQSFDLIVCKASFDAILCSGGSKANILRVVRESVRLLASGHGIFFLVTHGNPDSRVEYLEHENDITHYWNGVNVHKTARSQRLGARPSLNQGTDYVYICRKRVMNLERELETSASGLDVTVKPPSIASSTAHYSTISDSMNVGTPGFAV